MMEQQTLLQELNSLIEYYSKRTDCPPTYTHRLQSLCKTDAVPFFADEVMNSALDPNKRKYKKLKIKITKDDNQLELE